MNNTNYTREQINNAIFEVLTKQYKKDAKDAHRIVEEVGYKIEKWNGSFRVTNPKTNRYLHINWGYYRSNLYIRSGEKRFDHTDELKPFDFVGQLETTRKVYEEPYDDESEAYAKYMKIKHNDDMAMLYAEDIKQTLEKIASLQNDLVRYTKWQAEYEAIANEFRKQYGLKK